jgi:hypothetical protein
MAQVTMKQMCFLRRRYRGMLCKQQLQPARAAPWTPNDEYVFHTLAAMRRVSVETSWSRASAKSTAPTAPLTTRQRRAVACGFFRGAGHPVFFHQFSTAWESSPRATRHAH